MERSETEHSWLVPAGEVADSNYNLDMKNPASQDALVHRSPQELLVSISEKEQRITEIVGTLESLLAERPEVSGP